MTRVRCRTRPDVRARRATANAAARARRIAAAKEAVNHRMLRLAHSFPETPMAVARAPATIVRPTMDGSWSSTDRFRRER